MLHDQASGNSFEGFHVKKTLLSLAALVFSATLGALIWARWSKDLKAIVGASSPVAAPPAKAIDQADHPKYPIAPSDDVEANPVSSSVMTTSNPAEISEDFFNVDKFKDILNLTDIVRQFVFAVENSRNKQIPMARFPLKPAGGHLLTEGAGADLVLSVMNSERYNLYIQLIKSANLKAMASYYRRHYSQFQKAFEELGDKSYFNDRLIEVIDLALATPEPKGPIYLTRPGVEFEFADPNLESLNALQKIILRAGPSNEKLIKAKFRELRQLILGQPG